MTEANKRHGGGKKLFHPQVSELPRLLRFALSGVIGNVIFVAVYNWSIAVFSDIAGTFFVYSVVYSMSIPLNHFLNCGLVFGFPPTQELYLQNLASNIPVGLSTLVVGAISTTYLERVGFEEWAVNLLNGEMDEEEEGGSDQFYISLVGIVITGVWSFVFLNIVNGPPKDGTVKKEE